MCMIDAALIFYPLAVGSLAYFGVRILRKHNESKKKTNTTPTTNEQQYSISSE